MAFRPDARCWCGACMGYRSNPSVGYRSALGVFVRSEHCWWGDSCMECGYMMDFDFPHRVADGPGVDYS